MKLSIWSCDFPDFLITPGIRILGTGADTWNSVQASYLILQTVEHDGNGTEKQHDPRSVVSKNSKLTNENVQNN